ncbi:MAG: molybdopterin molybdotransferase MoeA [Verrucomicrobia bacterium]|nr:molybdopterin molybdotransferase MoeA [Verrucomicrobiota bacterium]
MLLSEDETLARVLESVGPPTMENVPIWEAGNRVLAQDIVATLALPRFDNSTMDGYAVRAEDAETGARLLVCGEQAAGPDLGLSVGRGEAIRIYTGAPIPRQADAVIMQEDVKAEERSILVRQGVTSGENIRVRGGDLCEGQKVGLKGDLLTGPKLAAIASQGLSQVPVFKRPSVAIFATGSELRSQGQPLASGEIYETNRILLGQLVADSGAAGEIFPIVPDLEEAHLESFQRAERYEAIVVAGGVSVGAKDLVKPTLQKLGARLELWRVAVKPGKPFMFGRMKNSLIFGLPGNPVSAFVTFLLFARPALWKLGGRLSLELPRAHARLEEELVNRGDRPHYFRGIYHQGTFKPVGRQESHALFALSQANALCRLKPDQVMSANSSVEVIPI